MATSIDELRQLLASRRGGQAADVSPRIGNVNIGAAPAQAPQRSGGGPDIGAAIAQGMQMALQRRAQKKAAQQAQVQQAQNVMRQGSLEAPMPQPGPVAPQQQMVGGVALPPQSAAVQAMQGGGMPPVVQAAGLAIPPSPMPQGPLPPTPGLPGAMF